MNATPSLSQLPPTNPLLVTGREAARLLCISERTLFDLRKNGTIKAVIVGRSVRFAMADIAAAVERLRQEGGAG